MTKRVVVVGATGRIGRPLCRVLIGAGHAVVVFSRDPARAKDLVPGAAGYVPWSPERLPEEASGHLGSADAVVYYRFSFPVLDAALHDLLGQPDNAADAER